MGCDFPQAYSEQHVSVGLSRSSRSALHHFWTRPTQNGLLKKLNLIVLPMPYACSFSRNHIPATQFSLSATSEWSSQAQQQQKQ